MARLHSIPGDINRRFQRNQKRFVLIAKEPGLRVIGRDGAPGQGPGGPRAHGVKMADYRRLLLSNYKYAAWRPGAVTHPATEICKTPQKSEQAHQSPCEFFYAPRREYHLRLPIAS